MSQQTVETEAPELPSMSVGQVCTISSRPNPGSASSAKLGRKTRIKFTDGICEEEIIKGKVVLTTWYVFQYEHPAFPDNAFVVTCKIPPPTIHPTLEAYEPAKHPQFQNSDFPELSWLGSSTPGPDETFGGIKCKVFTGHKQVTSRDVNGHLVVEVGGKVRAGLDSKSGMPVFLEDDLAVVTYRFSDKVRPISLPPEVTKQLDLLAKKLLRSEERGRLVP